MVVAATSVVALAVTTAPPAAAENFTVFALEANSGPRSITSGADGNLWFTAANSHKIGRLTPEGSVTLFSQGITPASQPWDITLGPDGNVWFTEINANRIGRITPAGVVTEFATGISANAGLQGITAGADGNLWFTESNTGRIGRVTPAGTVTEFTAGITPGAFPYGIAAGPDGNVWYADYTGNRIGRVTPAGTVTEFTAGISAGSKPLDIAAGPDGSMWFTEFQGRRIGQITMNGLVFETPLLSADVNVKPWGITAGPDGNMWFTQDGNGVVARIDEAGTITEFNGGSTLTSPAGIAAGPDGRVYFAVYNRDLLGVVTGMDGSPFVPMTPTRVLDSRTATGGWNGPLVSGAPRTLDVTGIEGIPEWATSVVLNLTVTGSNLPSFLTVHPDGTAAPNASNLNFGAGETIANGVTVRTGKGGRITFRTAAGQTHVIADIVGYYGAGGANGYRFTSLTPTRILDSRTLTGGWNNKLGKGPLDNGRPLMVRGAGGVPVGAAAAVLNVTSTNSEAGSFLSIWPTGEPRPTASSLNFGAGQTIANLVTVPIGTNGQVSFFNAVGMTDVIVDVVGYYTFGTGDYYHALPGPKRILDDRVGLGRSGPWGPGSIVPVSATNLGGVPSGIDATAKSVVMNLTATNATKGSYVSAFPADTDTVSSSNLNFGAGQTIPNQVVVPLRGSTNGEFKLYNNGGNVDLIADATGWFDVN